MMALNTEKKLVVSAVEKVLYPGSTNVALPVLSLPDNRSGGPKKLREKRLGRPTVDCLHFACQDFKQSFTPLLRF